VILSFKDEILVEPRKTSNSRPLSFSIAILGTLKLTLIQTFILFGFQRFFISHYHLLIIEGVTPRAAIHGRKQSALCTKQRGKKESD
jgi:hypothetical protein